ncbi:MAG: hypothetical protein K8T20_03775 [Planctomycetes bacterium]|nr:hypothetical protein [Planctomycetota bacterium]
MWWIYGLWGLCEIALMVCAAMNERDAPLPAPRLDRGPFFRDLPAIWAIGGIACFLALIYYFSWLGRLFEP